MFHAEQRLNFRIICRKKRDRPFRLEKPVSFLLLDQTRAENPAGQMFGVRSIKDEYRHLHSCRSHDQEYGSQQKHKCYSQFFLSLR